MGGERGRQNKNGGLYYQNSSGEHSKTTKLCFYNYGEAFYHHY
jgi:hypothetical protein